MSCCYIATICEGSDLIDNFNGRSRTQFKIYIVEIVGWCTQRIMHTIIVLKLNSSLVEGATYVKQAKGVRQMPFNKLEIHRLTLHVLYPLLSGR